MCDFRSGCKGGFGSLASELLQRIYTQPVLAAEDRLRALAVCKWWRYSLAGPLASLTITNVAEDLLQFRKQLLWAIATQPAIVDFKLEMKNFSFELAAMDMVVRSPEVAVLHSINRQALRKLHCSVASGLCLPCPAIFPNLESLSLESWSVGPDWVCHLPSLNHLTYLSLSVSPRAEVWGGTGAGTGGHSRVLSFPALPSLCKLRLELGYCCSLVAPWGGMCALRQLEVESSFNDSGIDLSVGGAGPPHLEFLFLNLEGRARVDFALLHSLQVAQLRCEWLQGAATVQHAPSLTQLHLGLDPNGDQLSQPWVLEFFQNAPPSLRELELKGMLTAELAAAVAGLQHLHTLAVHSGEAALELPAGPLWQKLQVLYWRCGSPLPLALRGAPQLHTLVARLAGIRDLEVLLTLPTLRHLSVVEEPHLVQDEEEEQWQFDARLELVRRALPYLESLSTAVWN